MFKLSTKFYCPRCDKYSNIVSSCPFCRKDAIAYEVWDAFTEKERQEWLEKTEKNRPLSPDFFTNKEIEKAEKFDQEFRAELAEAEARKQYVPKCPTCGCPDIEKISAGAKAADVALFGLWGSNKRKLQFRCKNCGYEW